MSGERRMCQDYERRWRDFCVDKHLEDHWLERLNSLKGFNLVSICEGHSTQKHGTAGKYPHIYLKLKEKYLPSFAKDWGELRPVFLNEVHKLFQKGDTYFNLEFKLKLRAGIGRLIYQEELSLKLRRYQARTSAEMDADDHTWFEQSVESIEAFDHHVIKWAHGKSS